MNALSAFAGGEGMENVYIDTIRPTFKEPEPKPERTGEEIKTDIMERINSLGGK